MELISANPDIFDIIHVWAKANPFKFMAYVVGGWTAICLYNGTKHSF